MESKCKQFAWSLNEEDYHGPFETIDEAFDEATNYDESDRGAVWIGAVHYPDAESYVTAALVVEHVACQDEFGHGAAAEWPDATDGQLDELTAALRQAFGDWLDRHKLRDRFFLVLDAKQYMREGGEIVEAKGGA